MKGFESGSVPDKRRKSGVAHGRVRGVFDAFTRRIALGEIVVARRLLAISSKRHQ